MEESIAQNIMLLITTRPGENRFDPDYGNAVWDTEFENATSEKDWERIFCASMATAIERYETRICKPEITVRVNHVEQTYDNKKFVEIKKKAVIRIKALLKENFETFHFATEIFLSPLSVD
ncbi:GPW/gp25 family protein [Taibaiella soli]|nr:GPW/gp25 family protein [Taibaiella soli]